MVYQRDLGLSDRVDGLLQGVQMVITAWGVLVKVLLVVDFGTDGHLGLFGFGRLKA